jgi:hypothetical protein
MFLSYSYDGKLVANGWFELAELGFTKEELSRVIEEANPQQRKQWFALPRVGVVSRDGVALPHTVMDTSRLPWVLYCLKRLELMGLVSAEVDILSENLARQQILSKGIPAGNRQDVDARLLHGTFMTLGQDPLQDTWQALVILDAAGKLDRVDREACIEGILRFHYGKGLFGSIRKKDGLVIFGSTRDTFCAFESLRMLGGLGRVKDLERWRFRPLWTAGEGEPEVSWFQVEAWVCEKRLQRIVRERESDSSARGRSLLEPLE